MEENYAYAAKVKKVADLYQIEFIDFPKITLVQEPTMDKAIRAAQESLALTILDYENRGSDLPTPTEQLSDAIYIHVWMPYFRSIKKEVYLKKNVTIPQSLDLLAKESNINYSAAMVKGIKQELGITGENTKKSGEKSISFTTFMKKMIEFWDTEVQ